MKKENTKKNNKGFSLVELIVVIAIMAVLMVVLAPALLRYVEKARIQTDETTASDVLNAVETALSDDSVYQAVQAETSGATTITVNYTGTDGKVTTSVSALQAELDNTLKADAAHVVKKTSSKKHTKSGSNIYAISAEYSDSKTMYVVTGAWK